MRRLPQCEPPAQQFCFSVLSQSTMVVLQALSEYLIHKPPPSHVSLDVDLRITGRTDIRYHFNPKTAYAARSSRVRDPNQTETFFSPKIPPPVTFYCKFCWILRLQSLHFS